MQKNTEIVISYVEGTKKDRCPSVRMGDLVTAITHLYQSADADADARVKICLQVDEASLILVGEVS